MKAVLMAGGEGSRLRPLTSFRPKPLVPIGNRPVMEYALLLLKQHNILEVIITTHYLANEIESYFGDGSDLGMKLIYCSENTPLGTAGSIKHVQHFLNPKEPFIVLSADALATFNLTELIEFHQSTQSLGTLVLSRNPTPLEYGLVVIDDHQVIQKFIEKPTWSEVISDMVNVGIYVLEYKILEWLHPNRFYDWSQDVFPMLLSKKEKLYGHVMEGYWHDIGNLEQYREANNTLLDQTSLFYPLGHEYSKGIWIGEGGCISNEAVLIPPVIIGNNCKIKKYARIGPYTVIGDNGLIEEGTTIEHSILWDSPYIGANTKISGSVIGTRATLKPEVTIYEDTVIGDRCLIDTGSIVKPKVKIWGDKVIESGSTVSMSLVWGNKWHKHLFHQTGLTGLSNIEITPDFVTRIGSALGSTLPNQARILISYDNTPISRLIERAITASLLSVGCNIFELKNIPLAINRYFLNQNRFDSGIHIGKFTKQNQSTLIEIFDEKGNFISKSAQRKIENTFFREDFHRINPEEVGTIKTVSQAFKKYKKDYLEFIKIQEKLRNIKIVCDYGYDITSKFFPFLLKHLNIESIGINYFKHNNFNSDTPKEIEKRVTKIYKLIKESKSDFGVLFIEGAKRIILVSNKGEMIKENALVGLYGLLIKEIYSVKNIAITHKVSHQMEYFLVNHGINVLRIDSLEEIDSLYLPFFIADHKGGFIFPEFHLGVDSMLAVGILITMLQKSDSTLNYIVNQLPVSHIQHEKIYCTWEDRGTLMRKINDLYQYDNQIDFKGGIKLQKDDHWILVLPDSNEPILNIYIESFSESSLKELTQSFFQTIANQLHN